MSLPRGPQDPAFVAEIHPALRGHERELAPLISSGCGRCRHKWITHFDFQQCTEKPCAFTRNGEPACECKSFLPPTPQAAEALRLLDDPLVLEAKKALGIIPAEELTP